MTPGGGCAGLRHWREKKEGVRQITTNVQNVLELEDTEVPLDGESYTEWLKRLPTRSSDLIKQACTILMSQQSPETPEEPAVFLKKMCFQVFKTPTASRAPTHPHTCRLEELQSLYAAIWENWSRL